MAGERLAMTLARWSVVGCEAAAPPTGVQTRCFVEERSEGSARSGETCPRPPGPGAKILHGATDRQEGLSELDSDQHRTTCPPTCTFRGYGQHAGNSLGHFDGRGIESSARRKAAGPMKWIGPASPFLGPGRQRAADRPLSCRETTQKRPQGSEPRSALVLACDGLRDLPPNTRRRQDRPAEPSCSGEKRWAHRQSYAGAVQCRLAERVRVMPCPLLDSLSERMIDAASCRL